MAGISSRAASFGNPQNKKGYNGNEIQSKEFSDGNGLELYDFNARSYDQQIGRFMQIDPMSDEENQESWTPYHFTFNNPILYNDPDGKYPPLVLHRIYQVVKYMHEIEKSTQKAMSGFAQTVRVTRDNVRVVNTTEVSVPTVERNLLKPKENTAAAKKKPIEIVIDGEKHPESAQHASEASNSGSKVEGVVDRKGASDRRRENLRGKETEKVKDRDEFPPAVIKTNGKVSVRLIKSGDNRGSGSSIGHQLQNVPDNTRVVIIINPPKL